VSLIFGYLNLETVKAALCGGFFRAIGVKVCLQNMDVMIEYVYKKEWI